MPHTIKSISYTESKFWLLLGWVVFVMLLLYLYQLPDQSIAPSNYLFNTTTVANLSTQLPTIKKQDQNFYLVYNQDMQKYSLQQIFNLLSTHLSQITTEDINQILQLSESQRLQKLTVNDHFQVTLTGENEKIKAIRHSRLHATQPHHYELSTIILNPNLLNAWSIQPHSSKPKMMLHYAIVQVTEQGLIKDAKEAIIPDEIIQQLVDIFAWDLDLTTTRNGDLFRIAWEMHEWDMGKGRPTYAPGAIIYADFLDDREKRTLMRYYREDKPTEPEYFTANGQTTKKAFLRVPLKSNYIISSEYNLNRFHPILHKIIAHKGTDYSAPVNTEVLATGRGKIKFIGWDKNGYGNIIIISHEAGYTTKYAHLNKFVPNLRIKQIVEQGEVIGYVGDTGGSTAPHLHYEFLIDGKHTNPTNVALPDAKPLTELTLHKFSVTIKHFESIFDRLQTAIYQNQQSDYFYTNVAIAPVTQPLP